MKREDLAFEVNNPFVRDGNSLATSINALQNEHKIIELQGRVVQQVQNSKQKLFDAIQKQTDELNQLSISNEFIKQINQIYLNNPTNIEAFTDQINKVKDKLLNAIPNAEQRSFFRSQFEKDIDSFSLNISKNYLKRSIEDTFIQTKDAIDNAAVSATIAINSMFDVNKDDLAVIDESLSKLGEAYLNVEAMLSNKDANGTPYFNENQKKELMDRWEASVLEAYCKRKLQSLPIDEQIKFVKDFNDRKPVLSIPYGHGNAIEISGRELSFKSFNSLSKSLTHQLKEYSAYQKEQNDLNSVKEVISGEINPDPKDKNYRTAVNTYYEKYVKPNISFESPLESLNVLGEFISKTKTIPEGVESDLRAYLSSDNFMAFSFASDVIKNISVNNPSLIDYIPEKDIAKALTMNRMTSAGVSPEEAFNTITKSFSSVSEDIREQRIRSFNKQLNDEKVQADFEASVMKSGWFFWKENKEPVDIVADEFYYQFTDLARDFYVMGADFDTARESALACMKKRWGNSVVNGDNTLTALPPEKYYSDYALTGEIMRDLLLDYVKDKLPEGANEDNVIVLADRATYATAGNPTSKPSYVLCYINEMGVPEPILGDDLSTVRIGENVWNKEARFMYEQKKFKGKNKRPEIDLIELFEAGEF